MSSPNRMQFLIRHNYRTGMMSRRAKMTLCRIELWQADSMEAMFRYHSQGIFHLGNLCLDFVTELF